MTIEMAARPERFETCNGLAQRAFVAAPNTKYNPDGVFKLRLHCDLADPAVQAFKAKVDAAAREAFLAQLPPDSREGWQPFLPYETAEDGASVCFRFYRSAKVVLSKTKEKIDLSVGVFDATGTYLPTPPYIGDGSLVKVWAEFRAVKLTAGRMAGVRFEFSALKLLRLAQPKSPFSDDAAGGHPL